MTPKQGGLEPCFLDIPVIRDAQGAIGAINELDDIPFSIARCYYMFDLTSGSHRGEHAHKALQQLVIAVNGALLVRLHDGQSMQSWCLDDPSLGLYIPAGFWRSLSEFSEGTTVVVLASLPFDEADYIRDWEEFLTWKNT